MSSSSLFGVRDDSSYAPEQKIDHLAADGGVVTLAHGLVAQAP